MIGKCKEVAMIVERRTYKAKLGKLMDLVALNKQERDRIGMSSHVYTSLVGGAGGRMVMDLPFEDEAAREEFWKEWNARPEAPAFTQKWNELIENDFSIELLTMQY
jgi:hypothetical protein